MEGPNPRDHPKRKLETARPVDAELRRVGVHPGRSLRNKCFREALIAGETVRLTEGHKVRVPVQLPDGFLIAGDVWIEIIDFAPMDQGRLFAGGWIEMPVNRRPKNQVSKTQQIEAAEDCQLNPDNS